jgi:hypothetical protein
MTTRMRTLAKPGLVLLVALVAAGACGSSTNYVGPDAAAGGGTGGGGGHGGAGGGGRGGAGGGVGGASAGGAGGAGGGGGAAGAGGSAVDSGSGANGTQPIGSACANTGNCSQADGTVVCCLSNSTCVIDTQCPGGTNYVPCSATQPCTKAGWVCCNAGGMQFCTKPSACP